MKLMQVARIALAAHLANGRGLTLKYVPDPPFGYLAAEWKRTLTHPPLNATTKPSEIKAPAQGPASCHESRTPCVHA